MSDETMTVEEWQAMGIADGEQMNELLRNGWTLTGALHHVEGSCDIAVCPAH